MRKFRSTATVTPIDPNVECAIAASHLRKQEFRRLAHDLGNWMRHQPKQERLAVEARVSSIMLMLLCALLIVITGSAQGQTWEEYSSPSFWQRQKASVQSRDNATGKTLAERAAYCESEANRVSQEVDRAGAFVISFHLLASPSVGYIAQAAAAMDQREMGTAATVAFRDIRSMKYDGADTAGCRRCCWRTLEARCSA